MIIGCPSSVNNFFKQHLVEFHQTSQECSLGGLLSNLLKDSHDMQNSCKNLLTQFKNNLVQMVLRLLSTKIDKINLIC